MPPQRGMWIPPDTVHNVRIIGAATMQSLYFEPDVPGGLPKCCQVVGVSRFIRALMYEALDLPLLYDVAGRAGALMILIRHETVRLPIMPLSLSLPPPGRLRQALSCVHEGAGGLRHHRIMVRGVGYEPAQLHARFQAGNGSQLRGMVSADMPRSRTPASRGRQDRHSRRMELGYDNPNAFTSMFKRLLGLPPRSNLASEKSIRLAHQIRYSRTMSINARSGAGTCRRPG